MFLNDILTKFVEYLCLAAYYVVRQRLWEGLFFVKAKDVGVLSDLTVAII